MTRKHFTALAWELRTRYPEPGDNAATDLGSDYYAGRVRAWESCVTGVVVACRDSNPRFDVDRFMVAAGFTRRPDGSMFPMSPPR